VIARLAGWLPGRSIVEAFRRDRALRWGFLLLSATALSPLFVTPILPHADLHGDVSSAAMLYFTAFKVGSAADYYRVIWQPFPYWVAYLLMGAAHLVGGAFFAAKVTVGALALALPLSVLRLLLALGRDPKLALWSFAISWHFGLHAGRHAFLLGMALGLCLLARVVEARDDREALRLWPWALLLSLCHALALGFTGVAAAALALASKRPRARLRRAGVALAGSALVVVPWLGSRFLAASAGPGVGFRFEFPSPRDRVSGLLRFTLDTLAGPDGEAIAALSFALLTLGSLALARLPEREGPDRHRWAGVALLAVALGLYGALPMSIYGPVDDWQVYLRFAPFVLASLLLIPRPSLAGTRATALLPGVLLAAASHLATCASYRSFGDRVRPFLAIVDEVPRGARVLPLEYTQDDRALPLASIAHIHSYITAEKLTFDPHFFDNPNTPIRPREGLTIPLISWLSPAGFTFARYAPHYTHILVQGLDQDPLASSPQTPEFRPRLLKEAGIWRLYAIERP